MDTGDTNRSHSTSLRKTSSFDHDGDDTDPLLIPDEFNCPQRHTPSTTDSGHRLQTDSPKRHSHHTQILTACAEAAPHTRFNGITVNTDTASPSCLHSPHSPYSSKHAGAPTNLHSRMSEDSLNSPPPSQSNQSTPLYIAEGEFDRMSTSQQNIEPSPQSHQPTSTESLLPHPLSNSSESTPDGTPPFVDSEVITTQKGKPLLQSDPLTQPHEPPHLPQAPDSIDSLDAVDSPGSVLDTFSLEKLTPNHPHFSHCTHPNNPSSHPNAHYGDHVSEEGESIDADSPVSPTSNSTPRLSLNSDFILHDATQLPLSHRPKSSSPQSAHQSRATAQLLSSIHATSDFSQRNPPESPNSSGPLSPESSTSPLSPYSSPSSHTLNPTTDRSYTSSLSPSPFNQPTKRDTPHFSRFTTRRTHAWHKASWVPYKQRDSPQSPHSPRPSRSPRLLHEYPQDSPHSPRSRLWASTNPFAPSVSGERGDEVSEEEMVEVCGENDERTDVSSPFFQSEETPDVNPHQPHPPLQLRSLHSPARPHNIFSPYSLSSSRFSADSEGREARDTNLLTSPNHSRSPHSSNQNRRHEVNSLLNQRSRSPLPSRQRSRSPSSSQVNSHKSSAKRSPNQSRSQPHSGQPHSTQQGETPSTPSQARRIAIQHLVVERLKAKKRPRPIPPFSPPSQPISPLSPQSHTTSSNSHSLQVQGGGNKPMSSETSVSGEVGVGVPLSKENAKSRWAHASGIQQLLSSPRLSFNKHASNSSNRRKESISKQSESVGGPSQGGGGEGGEPGGAGGGKRRSLPQLLSMTSLNNIYNPQHIGSANGGMWPSRLNSHDSAASDGGSDWEWDEYRDDPLCGRCCEGCVIWLIDWFVRCFNFVCCCGRRGEKGVSPYDNALFHQMSELGEAYDWGERGGTDGGATMTFRDDYCPPEYSPEYQRKLYYRRRIRSCGNRTRKYLKLYLLDYSAVTWFIFYFISLILLKLGCQLAARVFTFDGFIYLSVGSLAIMSGILFIRFVLLMCVMGFTKGRRIVFVLIAALDGNIVLLLWSIFSLVGFILLLRTPIGLEFKLEVEGNSTSTSTGAPFNEERTVTGMNEAYDQSGVVTEVNEPIGAKGEVMGVNGLNSLLDDEARGVNDDVGAIKLDVINVPLTFRGEFKSPSNKSPHSPHSRNSPRSPHSPNSPHSPHSSHSPHSPYSPHSPHPHHELKTFGGSAASPVPLCGSKSIHQQVIESSRMRWPR
eukprot:GHVN01104327.1.p1 GENE.GHVN01104327.1~~GHVN01104327.1.p1  ORF type:complete len:1229 (+),score=397.58 GHVN01104327.1:275-3961(+)